MKPILSHSWHLSEVEALTLQGQLAAEVIKEDQLRQVNLIAGVDVAYSKKSDRLVAAVVILNANTLKVIETATTEDRAQFPYVPGLLSFRELPPLIKVLAKLRHSPDLIICDGQGYAHPRRFGLACHLGVVFGIPTIGCGKTRLVGDHDELNEARGARVPLIDKGEVVGSVLRTQSHTNPVYISIGHRISLATACQYILKTSPEYRLPETTRQADQTVRSMLKG